MSDMGAVIIPKSDQLNADDLIAGPRTIKITAVTIRGGQEQPIAISYEGDDGKPYKACKGMCRIMVMAWGPDSKKYTGRSMTLFRNPTVKWAGMEVGGIQISHMSDIDATMTVALTATRGNRKPFTVQPIMLSITRDDVVDTLVEQGKEQAELGMNHYEAWWMKTLTAKQRTAIGPERHAEMKAIATAAKPAEAV